MERPVHWRAVPDVSKEQRLLDQLVKQVRKLQWIGRAEDAERVKLQLMQTALDGTPAISQSVRMIIEANVHYYRKLLETESDQLKRKTVVKLLGEEEEKLSAGIEPQKKRLT